MPLPEPIRSFKQYQMLHPEKKEVVKPKKPQIQKINPEIKTHLTSIEVAPMAFKDKQRQEKPGYLIEILVFFVIFLIGFHYLRKWKTKVKQT